MPFAFNGIQMKMLGSSGEGGKGRRRIWALGCAGGSPQIADLDGDGWMEIVMVARDKRLKIWRFDQRQKKAEGHRYFVAFACH
jgi:hypothetical protein